jgi:hypothetical protein
MFTVRWVARGQEATDVEIEKYRILNPDVIVQGCGVRLEGMQKQHQDTPIDGFIVLDGTDKVIRKWFPFKI